jgi:hypothetical protein
MEADVIFRQVTITPALHDRRPAEKMHQRTSD